MAELWLPKPIVRVRFPSPAPLDLDTNRRLCTKSNAEVQSKLIFFRSINF